MKAFSEKRWKTQPAAPSAGCIFKNPEKIPAGRLMDELGLKGTRVGGAVVSAEHGNFIVNDGNRIAVIHDEISVFGGHHGAAHTRAFQAEFIHQPARWNLFRILKNTAGAWARQAAFSNAFH